MFQIQRIDLLNANAAAICHQVNCCNVMGAGVAKAIYTEYPEVKTAYHSFCKEANRTGDQKSLLGKIQVVEVNHGTKAVINVFGQLNYGRRGCYTDYEALKTAFNEINRICASKRIAFPYGFGCGLAGGDWSTVEKLMVKHLWNCDVVVCLKE